MQRRQQRSIISIDPFNSYNYWLTAHLGYFLPRAAEIDEGDIHEVSRETDGHCLFLQRTLGADEDDVPNFLVLPTKMDILLFTTRLLLRR